MSSGEFEIIERYFLAAQGLAAPGLTPTPAPDGVVLGIGDDAAILELPMDRQLVAAVDTLVEGRHFIAGADPRSIGHRALAVNLSDLAAMGATPAWATLALTLPAAYPNWLAGFSSGLLELAAEHGVALVGGDTTRGPLTISVQLLGHVPRGTAICRGGAQAGDLLVVTGTLGDAGAGLDFLQSAAPLPPGASDLVRRHEYPTPRVAFGVAARGLASAAMDLSDGLTGDLPKLARASSLAARVDVEKLPMSTALRSLVPEARARELALGAGDDYELLLAVPPIRYVELAAAAARLDLRLTQVGGLKAGEGVAWCLNGEPFSPGLPGYDHFR